jgi:ADP-dependent NAD(P)H-hydrate dehydratase / NAD(P)H-hydrate epimerase
VADIGSPASAIVSELQLNVITARILRLVGPRPAESNKGSYGHVLVVGGSLGKAGSAAMAGMAALRSGRGFRRWRRRNLCWRLWRDFIPS